MIEGVGPKLQQARLARGLTLDEAGRLTKIRPGKLAEIEAEDFSNFASLAYAKGFLQIYGKFLDVDVTPYLEAFETPDQMTVDGYSYLQDNPAPAPPRPAAVARKPARSDRGSLLPFAIGVVVLVLGFTILKFFLDVKRIAPRPTAATTAVTPTAAPERIVAPRALPVDNTPPPAAQNRSAAAVAAATASTTSAITQATPAAVSPAPVTTTSSEPEVRRAEPVHAEDLATGSPAAASETPNRIEIRPLKKTYLKVIVDGDTANPAIERWVSTSDSPLRVTGQRIMIRALDAAAVEVRKNGKRVAETDPDVTIE